jgi:hypothetical protein
MRIEKRKKSDVYGLQLEANRTQQEHEKGREFYGSDIDWERTNRNVHLIYSEKWISEIKKQMENAHLNRKPRKDAIYMLDGIYTASKEWFENASNDDIQRFFTDCLEFHRKEYGEPFNAVIHYDETTPHMHIASVPLIEDEKGYHLSADRIMGNRTQYSKRQDRFWEEIGKPRGLERGEIKKDALEKKVHQTAREYNLKKLEHETLEAESKLQRRLEQTEELGEGIKHDIEKQEKRLFRSKDKTVTLSAAEVEQLTHDINTISYKTTEYYNQDRQHQAERAKLEKEKLAFSKEKAAFEKQKEDYEAEVLRIAKPRIQHARNELEQQYRTQIEDLTLENNLMWQFIQEHDYQAYMNYLSERERKHKEQEWEWEY